MRRDIILGMIYDKSRDDEEFNYPDYGLPIRIADALTPEFVDAVQNCWHSIKGEHVVSKAPFNMSYPITRKKWISDTLAEMNRLGDKASDYSYL